MSHPRQEQVLTGIYHETFLRMAVAFLGAAQPAAQAQDDKAGSSLAPAAKPGFRV